tara:strand:+ start:306 stop:605 length:300 start_codon:yes stop_codon:yes gene_type:complete
MICLRISETRRMAQSSYHHSIGQVKGRNFGDDMRRKAIGLGINMRKSGCSETIEREKPNGKNTSETPGGGVCIAVCRRNVCNDKCPISPIIHLYDILYK